MAVTAIGPGRMTAEKLLSWSDAINLLLNPPGAQLRQSVAQSIANAAAFTPLTFTTEDYDNRNGHSTASNTSRYVCQVAGRYQLSGTVSWASSGSGQRAAQWFVNGSAVNGSQSSMPAAATGPIPQVPARTMTVLLTVGQYVELCAFQDSGGSLSTSVANAQVQSMMSVRWVGEA